MFLFKKKYWITPGSDLLPDRQGITTGGNIQRDFCSVARDRSAASTVMFKDALCTSTFVDATGLSALCGRTDDCSVVLNLAKMPHTLIAGTTGSGKSVLLHSMICSLLFKHNPNHLKLVMIDPKRVEFGRYNSIEHMMMPVVTDADKAPDVLSAMCQEMDHRYRQLEKAGLRNNDGRFPSILIVIDELADLMLTHKKECEKSIIRIAQLGRAAGIHLLIATQRPSANVLTGLIRANIPCKICLKVSSVTESVLVLGHKGAEQLSGMGDSLLRLPNDTEEIRFQAAYIGDNEIATVCQYWSDKKRCIIRK